MSSALQINDLHFDYPDGTSALRGVDLVVQPGERVAVLGPNGAGKTTLMLHSNGLLRARSGSIRVAGQLLADESLAQIRQQVGMVFQDPDDQLFMPTVADDVAFGPANAGLSQAEITTRVEKALTEVGMWAQRDRPPHHLSLGQRRRVAVATVLAMDPELLVLDEPSSNMDPTSRRELADILLSSGRTLAMVTHDLPYAAQICPRAVILNEGRIKADGPTLQLLADEQLLRENRLELPYGFDPAALTA
ncbi:MAG: energy-coupling factor ABC transporter ATP-binding protein [Actinomycetia bacterium]|nr:energy-coupling factor ABC transporter ATP-binding protein [Actinomycetes bacterium]MCH9801908.1 energy-coupling factor ABC transporter ATP-binding protein [Actinomycetes bacterium]